MLRQIRYFQAVVRCHSFSEAAEECHISQSAISQQVKALENELGFALLERKNRSFALTPAGEHFYRKSLVLMADYERLRAESAHIAQGDRARLTIGYLRSYAGREVQLALEEFASAHPQLEVRLLYGNHEELFDLVRGGGADVVLNDQRRAFSEEYVNLVLSEQALCIELAVRDPMAALPAVTVEDVKNVPCILVASEGQREIERAFYQTVIGLQGDFLYAENLEEARLLVVSGQGFLPAEGGGAAEPEGTVRLPLCRGEEPIMRRYGLFWKKNNPNPMIEAFAAALESKFG